MRSDGVRSTGVDSGSGVGAVAGVGTGVGSGAAGVWALTKPDHRRQPVGLTALTLEMYVLDAGTEL